MSAHNRQSVRLYNALYVPIWRTRALERYRTDLLIGGHLARCLRRLLDMASWGWLAQLAAELR